MRTVWVIGTKHDYQRVRRASDEPGPEEFRAVLTTIATQKGVRAIAEEMSPEALARWKADDSVCRQVAHGLGICHRYCDPASEERKDLAIVEDDDIRMSGSFAGRDQQAIEDDVRASQAIRESRWLEHLLEMDAWPLLFVCGRDHAGPFSKRLRANEINAHVLFDDWAPNR